MGVCIACVHHQGRCDLQLYVSLFMFVHVDTAYERWLCKS
jgi:hypothetical protein